MDEGGQHGTPEESRSEEGQQQAPRDYRAGPTAKGKGRPAPASPPMIYHTFYGNTDSPFLAVIGWAWTITTAALFLMVIFGRWGDDRDDDDAPIAPPPEDPGIEPPGNPARPVLEPEVRRAMGREVTNAG